MRCWLCNLRSGWPEISMRMWRLTADVAIEQNPTFYFSPFFFSSVSWVICKTYSEYCGISSQVYVVSGAIWSNLSVTL